MNNATTPQTPGTAAPAVDPAKKAPDATTPASTAAKGNDDVMSQPAKKS